MVPCTLVDLQNRQVIGMNAKDSMQGSKTRRIVHDEARQVV